MTTEDKLRIQVNRQLGEFTGILEGILTWDIPKELRERLEGQIEKLCKMQIEPAEESKLDLDKMSEKVDELIQNLTPEEIEEYFKDDTPKGWVSIEDHLPQMYAEDIGKGYSEYKVKNADGCISTTRVTDHTMWYYMAKDHNITHWLNESIETMEREELIQLCKDAVVHHTKWQNRDSYSSQKNLQSIYQGLTAGLDYRIVTKEIDSAYYSDERTLIIKFLQPIDLEKLKTGKHLQISSREAYWKDCDPDYKSEMFDGNGIDFDSSYTQSYMPTRKRIEQVGIGNDWY